MCAVLAFFLLTDVSRRQLGGAADHAVLLDSDMLRGRQRTHPLPSGFYGLLGVWFWSMF